MAKKDVDFSKAFSELEEITQWFETEDVNLDEGLKKFERGLTLAKQCKQKLQEVETRVTEIKEQFSELTEEPSAEEEES